MKQVIFLIQTIIAILVAVTILIQQKGAGLGSTFGGEMGFYRTRRGAEKLLFYATIVLIVLFVISSIVGLMV
jgi:protein translocase SecG subunit